MQCLAPSFLVVKSWFVAVSNRYLLMVNFGRKAVVSMGLVVLVATCGCHTSDKHDTSYSIAGSSGEVKRPTEKVPRKRKHTSDARIRHIRCLYDQKPWISTDRAGDRDPEGIQYRVFLEPATVKGVGKSILRDGEIYIEMYIIERKSDGTVGRALVSDWRYPTSTFQTIRSTFLGMGYHIWLRWATKSIAGKEIEIITWFEDVTGQKVRSGTKRFRVPRYAS